MAVKVGNTVDVNGGKGGRCFGEKTKRYIGAAKYDRNDPRKVRGTHGARAR